MEIPPPPPPDSLLGLRISDSRLTVATATADVEKAWHFLALLLSHGRPAVPADIASKCSLFYSNPDFIRFLCSIPNSPIRLVHECATFSQTGLDAVAQFFANFQLVMMDLDSPRFVPRLIENVRSSSFTRTYCRKRKRPASELSAKKRCYIREYEEKKLNKTLFTSGDSFQNLCAGVLAEHMSGRCETNSCYSSILEIDWQKPERAIFSSKLSSSSTLQHLERESVIVDYGYNLTEDDILRCHLRQARQSDSLSHDKFLYLMEATPEETLMKSVSHSELSLLQCTTSNSKVSEDGTVDILNFITHINHGTSSWLGVDQRTTLPQSANGTMAQACTSLAGDMNGKSDEVWPHDTNRWDVEGLPTDEAHTDSYHTEKAVKFSPMANNVHKERIKVNQQSQGGFPEHPMKSSSTPKVDKKNSTLHEKCQTMENCMCIGPHTELEQYQKDKEPNRVKHRTKLNYEHDTSATRKMETTTGNTKGPPCTSIKNVSEHRPFPEFESFVVEKEEGSGGYGTVYRARRKSDGIIFAIKYPHAKANRNHVLNELKMLHRVRGKSNVIKYEGSFKSGDSDCLVLEHFKHDRPEVLKREIDIYQLQWYGYCMFRALAGLHKLGIVHRDVKPGNFLFSRTVNNGFLIDFNLALDLHRKQGAYDNPKAGYDPIIKHNPLPRTKSLPPAKDRMSTKTSFQETIIHNTGKGSKSLFPSGSLKKKVNQVKVYTASRNINKSQGADGSGITSAKDATSTRTPLAERLRQPIPSKGRKELISWAQEALQGGGNHEPVKAPIGKRKRVAALPQTTDKKCLYPTPMPLHASVMAIHGNRKHKREGPCMGTKGFRAPEVLFKSVFQGLKIDIWSAGVTLLYLMIGRTPFTGEPDQNIKEIAKLRGSEDLWEVAKLHNQESLFPQELFDVNHLSPVKLRDWCERNTKRPDFLEAVPTSLFDLVDMCLTVNPRLRISAEEALRHKFFAPCHEQFRKQRLQRQALSVDSATTLLLNGES